MKRKTIWTSSVDQRYGNAEVFSIVLNPSQTLMISTHQGYSMLHDLGKETTYMFEQIFDAVFISETEWISVPWYGSHDDLIQWEYKEPRVEIISRFDLGRHAPQSLFYDGKRWISNAFFSGEDEDEGDRTPMIMTKDFTKRNMWYLFSSQGMDYVSIGHRDIFETQLDQTDRVLKRVYQHPEMRGVLLSPCATMVMSVTTEDFSNNKEMTMFRFPTWEKLWTIQVPIVFSNIVFSPNSEYCMFHDHLIWSRTGQYCKTEFQSICGFFLRDSASLITIDQARDITRYRLFKDELICALLWQSTIPYCLINNIRRKLLV